MAMSRLVPSLGREMPMDTATLLHAIYTAYRERRVDVLLGYLDDEFHWVVHLSEAAFPGGERARDKAETAATLKRIMESFDLLTYDPGPIIATDQKATVQPRIRIRDKQTDAVLETKMVHTWHVKNGKAVALDEKHHDRATVEAFFQSSEHKA
jgi:ketosteroid isomerase-like protein